MEWVKEAESKKRIRRNKKETEIKWKKQTSDFMFECDQVQFMNGKNNTKEKEEKKEEKWNGRKKWNLKKE